ncbi:VOC family protein [bacterium]|nr:MAG: VOC family protein [bacterium]
MKRVTGIGGVFIKSRNPDVLKAWYRTHLGLDIQDWGGVAFQWSTPENPNPDGTTVWSVFEESSQYFAPSKAPFMVNYRVEDLHAVLDALRSEGCDVDEKTEESEFGKFGWVMDPDGNRVELWEPPLGPIEG